MVLPTPSPRRLHLATFLALLPWTTPSAPAQALPNGGSVLAAISFAGDQDTYTFTATAGNGVFLRVADIAATPLTPGITLYDPTGAYVTDASGTDVGTINHTAMMTGTYTVVVADNNTYPIRDRPLRAPLRARAGSERGRPAPQRRLGHRCDSHRRSRLVHLLGPGG